MKKHILLLGLLSLSIITLSCNESPKKEKKIEVKMEKIADGMVKATVTISENIDGKKVEKVQVIEGHEEDVKTRIDALTKTDEKSHKKIEKKVVKKMKFKLEPRSGSTASGTITFTETDEKVHLAAHINGLTPGTHAIHIHEKADCSSDDGTSSGGHWNPTFEPHGAWGSDAGFHRGDIGNFEADEKGHGMVSFATDLWCLGCEDETKNVLGKAVIVHAGQDDLTSQPSGAAGARVSCSGIIR